MEELQSLTENVNQSSILESLQQLKGQKSAKFDETVEAHINLDLDPKYANQQLRATVVLPKGIGKVVTIAVITQEENFEMAKEAGADFVGSQDLISKIEGGFTDFDFLIVTPAVLPMIVKLGKILGPRGLMPSPKSGTVTTDLSETIKEFKAGKIDYRVDKGGVIHMPVGKKSFTPEDLLININAICESINKNKPSGAKGKFWKSVYICSTMGPSIELDVIKFRESKVIV